MKDTGEEKKEENAQGKQTPHQKQTPQLFILQTSPRT
jgi:hypothetical protein